MDALVNSPLFAGQFKVRPNAAKYLFLDVETTHIDPVIGDPWAIAGAIEIGGEIAQSFSLRTRGFNPSKADPRALAVGKITAEELVLLPHPTNTLSELGSFLACAVSRYNPLDRLTIVAYNASFDKDFLYNFFKKGGKSLWNFCTYYPVDVYMLLIWAGTRLNHLFPELSGIQNYKLATVCAAFSIPLENAHDALADITATRVLLHTIESRIAGAAGGR
jgi:DNA polymerase-3 subunit epsilon